MNCDETDKPLDYHAIEGLITEAEADFIVELAREVPAGGLILNVGTWKNKSVACCLAGQPQAHIATVDVDNTRSDLLPDVEYLTGDSGEIAQEWTRELDFIFIDGNHSYGGVMRDVKFTERLKLGGRVAFHDYDAFMHECTYAIDDWWADHRTQFRKIDARGLIIVYLRVAL